MRLTFLGANHEVTGSCTLLQIGEKNVMIDCGMEQGEDHYQQADMPMTAAEVDVVCVTHAHIDHTGRLPLLYKEGFRGSIYATHETAKLCGIMLRDSANIQMSEAEYATRKAQRAGQPPVEPLYDLEDVEGLLKLFHPCDYNTRLPLCEGVDVRFTDIGHLLGSAAIEMWLKEGDTERKLVFSGDVGNTAQPIINDPKPVDEADYLVLESTYGDRLHTKDGKVNNIATLAQVLQRTLDRGGNVIIPAFAVGRTQEMLYFIREVKNRGLVQGHDGFPVYVDSPLANEATAIFMQCGMECLDPDAREVMQKGENPIAFEGLRTSVTAEDSKALNEDKTPKVIISASGMCDAGRIRHHLKYNLWRPECTVLFVGYQSNGTLGRALYEGAKTVKLFGDEVAVHAEIASMTGLSGHADQRGLLDWVSRFKRTPEQIFVNHGDDCACTTLAKLLESDFGCKADAPFSGSVFNLATDAWEVQAEPAPAHAKRKVERTRVKEHAYTALLDAARDLLDAAQSCQGRANRDLAAFADKIRDLIRQMRECEKTNKA